MTLATPIPMLDMVRLHAPMREALEAAFSRALDTGQFIGGSAVDSFEGALASHVGAREAVGVSSGTDALLVAMMALGVQPGDEVITTPYTFFATAGCIARLGARPVFVDIDPVSFNINVHAVASAVTPRTVGIIPVHLFGQCAEMDPLLQLAESKGLWVVEDAAQSIGATCRDRQSGTMGTVGAFSFFPAKNLGALGDGGAVVTNDPTLARRIRSMRQHGAMKKYRHEVIGGNFRLDSIQASFLSIKLPCLKGWEEGRRQVAWRYADAMGSLVGIRLPVSGKGMAHVYNQFVIRTAQRDRLAAALKEASIGCAIYYPTPLHLQACFEYLGHGPGSFPESERASRETLAIPIDPLLDTDAQERISSVIRQAILHAEPEEEN